MYRVWLEKVMKGDYPVPRCWEVVVKNCAVFPPKKEIIEELTKLLNNDIGITTKK